MSPPRRTLAVIPAAGHSRRMGRPKLSLPLGGRTVLECVIGSLRDAGIGAILVVVGPHVPELRPLARSAGAEVLTLPGETADMRATVEHGLTWLEVRYQPKPDDGWLLVPADHPVLDAAVVRALLAVAGESEASVIVPTYDRRRGHPVFLRWHHVAAIRAWPAGQGLNTYLRAQAAETLELPVSSPTILCDLDTPADYARLRSALEDERRGLSLPG